MTYVTAARTEGDTHRHLVNDWPVLAGERARAACGVTAYGWAISPAAWRRLPECPVCFDRAALDEAAWDYERTRT